MKQLSSLPESEKNNAFHTFLSANHSIKAPAFVFFVALIASPLLFKYSIPAQVLWITLSLLLSLLTWLWTESQETKKQTKKLSEETAEFLIKKEKQAVLGVTLSRAVHDLNNSLTSILGYSDLITEAPSTDVVLQYVTPIREESRRCRKILSHLLNFARYEKKNQYQVCSANELLESVIELKRLNSEEASIRFILDFDSTGPQILGDAYELQQVFLNLVDNAIEAVAKSKNKTIVVRTLALSPMVWIMFEDTGPGIPTNLKDKVLEPFFSTKIKQQGTGLGLALCLQILEQHEGILNFYNLSEGACFKITLPLASQKIQTEKGNQAMEQNTKRKFENVKVVVVDDEKHLLGFYEAALSRMGCQVKGFLTVNEAIDYLTEASFDLMIVDYRMKGETSKPVVDFVLDKMPHLSKRIIFSSGDTYDTKMKEMIDKMGNLFLPKPWTLEEIVETMTTALAR
jgi:signal transduction histidine kinase/CheY-like chemotaxis protein